MKRALFTIMILIAVTACGYKKEPQAGEGKGSSAKERGSSLRGQENTYTRGSAHNGFSDVYTENYLKDICAIYKVRDLGDPELAELYVDLLILQEKADEWAKAPGSMEELREITREIGATKGLIEYRSLKAYAAVH